MKNKIVNITNSALSDDHSTAKNSLVTYSKEGDVSKKDNRLIAIFNVILINTAFGKGDFLERFQKSIEDSGICNEKLEHLNSETERVFKYFVEFSRKKKPTEKEAKSLFTKCMNHMLTIKERTR